jgi:prepilin-type N-terminal cleavage/methylation domain-containing protein
MRQAQKGFTLVEIAIVLVIIGLLLGGILKGQEMIVQAKIKNVISDFSGISAAYHGYQDRYRAIPGDDAGASTRWTLGITTPNGDGVVQGKYNSATANQESRMFWQHLRSAGFVSGAGQGQPLNAASGQLGVQTGDAAGGAALGGFSGLMLCSANLPDKIAVSVDAQMDDGVPDKGSVRGGSHTGSNPDVGALITGGAATLDTAYVETGTTIYTVCRQL